MSAMQFESLATNAAKLELQALNRDSTDALGQLETQISGAVVAEYDAQIQTYSAELTVINDQKTSVRQDKVTLTGLAAKCQDITGKGYKITDESGTKIDFTGKAVPVSKTEYNTIIDLAKDYGVDVSNLPSGSGYMMPESLIESLKEALDSKLQDLNSSSEIKLIHFQSLMDARKQSLMMLSNMMNSDNQNKMAIIQNMKN